MTGKLSKNFHGVGIGPLSNILAVKIFIQRASAVSKVNHILGKEQQNQYGSTSKTINHEVCSKSFCCRCWYDKGNTNLKFFFKF